MAEMIQTTGLRKYILVSAGTLSLSLGILGIFLPLLPTTCFLLFSAWCYSRSSERFYSLLMTNRWFGPYIKDYREGRGISLRIKAMAVGSLWFSIGLTCLLWVSSLWLHIVLISIAVGVTWHVWRLPSKRESMGDVVYEWGSGADSFR